MFRRLSKLIRSLTKTEAVIFIAAVGITLFSSLSLAALKFGENTRLAPVSGGTYREGIVGQPTFINPALAGGNETDSDLAVLLFAPLKDLASRISSSKGGTIWDIRLKDNLFWQDGERVTADDVIFTIQTIQNPETRSSFAAAFAGVLAKRVSEREFTLETPQGYGSPLRAIEDLRPLPKHIWADIPPANFPLSAYNLEPVGSGPYALSKITKRRDGFITEIAMSRNPTYAGQKPYLNTFIVKFFANEKEALLALNTGAIDGLGGIDAQNLPAVTLSHATMKLRLPRYYAVFMNPLAQPLLRDKNIRLALNVAVSRREIIETVFDGYALPAYGPLLPDMDGYRPPATLTDEKDTAKANAILDAAGWAAGDDGIRQRTAPQDKGGATRLDFTLTVPDVPYLLRTADLLKEEWRAVGVNLSIQRRAIADWDEQVLKPRSYALILIGQALAQPEDLYSFWHSSQKAYPGLNVALYDNQTADVFIAAARRDTDPASRRNDLQSFQSVIENDLPAVFLYSPAYLYIARPTLHGFSAQKLETPADRFDRVEDWYVKTVRVFK